MTGTSFIVALDVANRDAADDLVRPSATRTRGTKLVSSFSSRWAPIWFAIMPVAGETSCSTSSSTIFLRRWRERRGERSALGAHLLTIHAAGGREMMQAAVEAARASTERATENSRSHRAHLNERSGHRRNGSRRVGRVVGPSSRAVGHGSWLRWSRCQSPRGCDVSPRRARRFPHRHAWRSPRWRCVC